MATKLKLQSNGFLYLIHWTSKKTAVKISTKIRINATDWNGTVGKLINTKLKDVNGIGLDDQIKKCEGAFLFAIDEYKAGRTSDIEKIYYERMNITVRVGGVNAPVKFLDYFNTKVTGYEAKKTSNHKSYRTAYNNLSAFLGRKRPTFDDLDKKFFEDFTEYLTTVKKYRISSIRSQVKLLKAIINTNEQNSNTKYKSFKLEKAEDINNVYLNLDELDKIYSLDLSKRPELEDSRNSFIVGAFTGLRFSDWGKVRADLIQADNSIDIRMQKTKKPAYIPVHKYVTAILKKYSGRMPEQIWNSEINKQIKIVCQLAGINNLVVKEYTKGGETKGSEPVEKYTLVSTHTARRSLCTNMIKEGAPVFAVMSVSGHRSLEAFQKYIKLDQDDITKALKGLAMFGGKPEEIKPKKATVRLKAVKPLDQPSGFMSSGGVL